jgi:hypothetical protein
VAGASETDGNIRQFGIAGIFYDRRNTLRFLASSSERSYLRKGMKTSCLGQNHSAATDRGIPLDYRLAQRPEHSIARTCACNVDHEWSIGPNCPGVVSIEKLSLTRCFSEDISKLRSAVSEEECVIVR